MSMTKINFEQVPLEVVRRAVERTASQPVVCAICGERVVLEKCKTDEDGAAVHADCYVQRISRSARAPKLRQ